MVRRSAVARRTSAGLFGRLNAAVLALCLSSFHGCSGLPIPELYNDAPSVNGVLFKNGMPVAGVDVRLIRRWQDIVHVDERTTDGNGKFSFGIVEHFEPMRPLPGLSFTKKRYDWELCFDQGAYCCSGSATTTGSAPDGIRTVCELDELEALSAVDRPFCRGELTNWKRRRQAFNRCMRRDPTSLEALLRGSPVTGPAAPAPRVAPSSRARRSQAP